MTTSTEHATYLASAAVPSLAGPGFYPAFSSIAGLGVYPPTHRDVYPFLRSRFDAFGYSAFIPEGTFRVEEARLEALKVWSEKNQKREEERVGTEAELEGYIVNKAKSEAEFWARTLVLQDLQRQIAAAELIKIQAETDKANSEKAKADAEAQLAAAQMAALNASASAEALSSPSAPPPAAEVKQLLHKLEQMDPCSGGYEWEDSPSEGGFRCKGGSHFKTYAEARAFTR